jgi:hypothetical protein
MSLRMEVEELRPAVSQDAAAEATPVPTGRRSSWVPVDYGESESAMGIARKVRALTPPAFYSRSTTNTTVDI